MNIRRGFVSITTLVWKCVLILLVAKYVYNEQKDIKHTVHKVSTDSYGYSLGAFIAKSTIGCILQCWGSLDCRSMSYNTVNRNCQLNREVVNLSSLTNACGSNCPLEYTEKDCKFDQACTDSSDCEENRNQTCVGGKCVCLTGYSFNAATCNCVTACDTYGTTFATLPGTKMSYGNTKSVQKNNVSECGSVCVAETSFICKTVEYVYGDKYCHLTDYTVLERIDKHVQSSCCDLFVRNCA